MKPCAAKKNENTYCSRLLRYKFLAIYTALILQELLYRQTEIVTMIDFLQQSKIVAGSTNIFHKKVCSRILGLVDWVTK
jgi:branched-subunit amino acid transport protein